MSQIPGKLVNCTLYHNGQQLIGQGEVTMPTIAPEMMEFKPFGIAGTVELPSTNYQSMECQVKVGVPNAAFMAQCVKYNETTRLTLRGKFQTVFPSAGVLSGAIAERVELELVPKTTNLGSRKQAEGGEFDQAFNVLSIGYFVDNAEIFFLDPVNYVHRVNGVDILAGDRRILGL